MLTARPELTPEKLFQKVSPYEIFLRYCQNWSMAGNKINRNFLSEFRPDDKDPSAAIRLSKYGNLYYVDYGENEALKPINFVMRKFNLSFPGALKKIFSDFGIDRYKLNESDSQAFQRIPYTPEEADGYKMPAIIKKKAKSWDTSDLNYWNQFAWTQDMLMEANIQSIKKYWVNGTEYPIFAEPSYSFEYCESEGVFRRKIYFPKRKKKRRFISNVDPSIIQGWHMLPKKGEILFITKALKDIGPFKRLGFPAIAPNSESSFIPESVIRQLKNQFQRIIIWFDFDTAGVTNARKFASIYGLEYTYNPPRASKDPSDFTRDFGLNNFNEYLKSVI